MDFDAVITGDRQVVARFAEWPKEIHDTLLERIKKLTDELYGRVRALAPEQSGKLKDEIVSKVFDDPEKIKGPVPPWLTQQGGTGRTRLGSECHLDRGGR